eukprot:5664869-Pyramimonas_sp.AAC.1
MPDLPALGKHWPPAPATPTAVGGGAAAPVGHSGQGAMQSPSASQPISEAPPTLVTSDGEEIGDDERMEFACWIKYGKPMA